MRTSLGRTKKWRGITQGKERPEGKRRRGEARMGGEAMRQHWNKRGEVVKDNTRPERAKI
ncbi:hypothetical protein E2C01_077716 [Portunus trituberculatus]|uniref:Uncharacterized protein n=1 Tax=Portunus trituberculatus TaxID=210409 RepID=A0A5B7IMT1_PORTR|nr:hypothetical protein [Portunus trituberculatus]